MVFHSKASQIFPGRLIQASTKLQTDSCQGFTDTITYIYKSITILIFDYIIINSYLYCFLSQFLNLHDTAQERVSVRTWPYTYYNVLCSTHSSSFVGKVENCGTNSQELIATAIYPDSHTTGGMGDVVSASIHHR